MNKFSVGQKIVSKLDSSMFGTVVAGPIDIKCQPQYIVQLDLGCGFFNPDRTCFVTMLVMHEDSMAIIAPSCRKCGDVMKSGTALQNTIVVQKDFAGDKEEVYDPKNPAHSGRTICANGPAVMIDCWKCPNCGHSITKA